MTATGVQAYPPFGGVCPSVATSVGPGVPQACEAQSVPPLAQPPHVPMQTQEERVASYRTDLAFWKKILLDCESSESPMAVQLKNWAEVKTKECKVAITRAKDLPEQREVLVKIAMRASERLAAANTACEKAQEESTRALAAQKQVQAEFADVQRQLADVEQALAMRFASNAQAAAPGGIAVPPPGPSAQQQAAFAQLQSALESLIPPSQHAGVGALLSTVLGGSPYAPQSPVAAVGSAPVTLVVAGSAPVAPTEQVDISDIEEDGVAGGPGTLPTVNVPAGGPPSPVFTVAGSQVAAS